MTNASSRHTRRMLLIALGGGALAACADRLALPATPNPPTAEPTPPPSPTLPPPTATLPPQPELRSAAQAEPLKPFTITAGAIGLDGAAEVRLFDALGRPMGIWPFSLQDGRGEVAVLPSGALGPQRAELWYAGERIAIADPLFRLEARTVVETGQERFDTLYPSIRGFMEQCRLSYPIDGSPVAGYRSPDNPLLWLRDHTYQARGFRYFEPDMISLIDAFRAAQRPDGSLPDWLANRALGVLEPGRKEVEADLEFLYVQAVYEAWQVTGDDSWMRQHIEPMRRALDYCMSDGLRWDAERGLIKRPYTIDMWDFSYGPTTQDPSTGRPAPRHWIDDQTIWGIFHGDNTGLARALNLLAAIEEYTGNGEEALRRRGQSDEVIDRLEELSWNGRFFTHFVPLSPFEPAGVDASTQLSISNTYALNREVLRAKHGRAIVEEYFERGVKRDPHVFAEWYSIDPPFPAGSYGLAGRPGEKPGEYVNGGIMPLVGGELARGAFRHGAEAYAFEILHRYHFLISSTGATYLWYYPEGNPGISGVDTLPTDGWGASAMLAALIEGAAGIEDRGIGYSTVRLSPRWGATADVRSARVVARYAASQAYAAYQWQQDDQGILLRYSASSNTSEIRLLLPAEVQVREVTLDGQPHAYEIRDVFGSQYLHCSSPTSVGILAVRW
ncbi:MAG: hypothetical protein Fur005_47980 [Roseiflexaceae bacterium]